jgi:hypothetical protein
MSEILPRGITMKVAVVSLMLGLGTVTGLPQAAIAVEWTKVTENSVGDKFFIDASAIQRKGNTAFYWEYREFVEPNNAFVEVELSQPLYGAVSRWSVDCNSKAQRLTRVNAYTKNRVLIEKFSYGEKGLAVQSRPNSSTYAVADFVCNTKSSK